MASYEVHVSNERGVNTPISLRNPQEPKQHQRWYLTVAEAQHLQAILGKAVDFLRPTTERVWRVDTGEEVNEKTSS